MKRFASSKVLPSLLILGSFATGFFNAPATTAQCTRTWDSCSFNVMSRMCHSARCPDCDVPNAVTRSAEQA